MKTTNIQQIDLSKLPSRVLAYGFTDELLDLLFPIEAGFGLNDDLSDERVEKLKRILREVLRPLKDKLPDSYEVLINGFFEQLPEVYDKLIQDAKAFVESDPAAESIEEVIVAYPGFYAISVYRIAHELYKLEIPILPRMMTEYAHNKTGIDIHPGAHIGNSFFIDHGTGVVIGQTTVVGNSVKLYQGVTLGALAVRKENQGARRHPTIEDNVIIYAGSCILGGETVVGHDSVIGGNVWLTASVPAFSVVYHKSDVKIRDKSDLKAVIDFVI
jgi:serine O-acetyltransferase